MTTWAVQQNAVSVVRLWLFDIRRVGTMTLVGPTVTHFTLTCTNLACLSTWAHSSHPYCSMIGPVLHKYKHSM
jgi:hypothetical protein